MKIGIRTPSPTKSVKARTTGRVKRAVKSSVNPVYGKKGIGYIKDPKRAVYNKIYHKLTIDPLDSIKHPHTTHEEDTPKPQKSSKVFFILALVMAVVCFGFAFLMSYAGVDYMLFVVLGALFLILGVWIY